MRGKKAVVGDTRVAPNGYHYTRTTTGWELTHRLIIEKSLGRKLGLTERVRFKDNDRTNLSLENLKVVITVPNIEARKLTIIDKIAELQAELEHLNSLSLRETVETF